MDADTIRIILIIVGSLMILALYLWERGRAAEDEEEGDDETDDGARMPLPRTTTKREPRLGPVAPSKTQRADPGPPPEDERLALAGQPAEAAEPSSAAVRRDELEPLLIQMSISARREHFAGDALLDAAEACGLRPGRMDIFHCLDEFDDDTRVYFSMANMVKPGTFPFDDMSDFSTPGVMLFAQLDGRPEDMTILEEMIATARKLASELDGEVLDETRRPLTVRKEEALREAVLKNERRWAGRRAAEL
jgi:cell division protein ZipA